MSQHTVIRTARITIQFTTPFHVGNGERSEGSDAGVVTDANGLPALPGSSLQGALRSAAAQAMGEHHVFALFGRPATRDNQDDAHAARLRFSWGRIHGKNDKPVTGLLSPGDIAADPVLDDAAHPTLRDHVRMNHRKVADADDQGKFDELAVSAGHRFTFEIVLHDDGDALEKEWNALLEDVLQNPATRFGGKTRRGFGAFKIVRLQQRAFDLSNPQDQAAWLAHPQSLAEETNLETKEVRSQSTAAKTITLTPETPWMVGGGDDPDADSAPVRDTRILWPGEAGHPGGDLPEIQECFLLPGSSVKGALAHRTCFHYNRLQGKFADKLGAGDMKNYVGEDNHAVESLFGVIANEEPSDGRGKTNQTGRPGIVFIDDVFIPVFGTPRLPAQNHVAIDPFTGGAKDTALFQDRPLPPGVPEKIEIPLSFQPGKTETLEPRVFDAFLAALDDLCQGRLALGAHSGRGYGFFSGTHDVQGAEVRGQKSEAGSQRSEAATNNE